MTIEALREQIKDLNARVAALRDRMAKQAGESDVRSVHKAISRLGSTLELTMAIGQVSHRLDVAEMLQALGHGIDGVLKSMASELGMIESDIRNAQP
jgi:hypothetical protein